MVRHRSALKRIALSAGLVLALVPGLLAQDLSSSLARVKGKKCEVYLKSGEVKKGKVKAVGDDYITVEVKLSPFYAEPQTFRLTQVSRIDYGSGVVDVESLLEQARQEEANAAAGQILGEPSPVPSTQPSKASPKPKAENQESQQQAPNRDVAPQDETVRRLMAILQSLDEGGTTTTESQKPAQQRVIKRQEPADAQSPSVQTRQVVPQPIATRPGTRVRPQSENPVQEQRKEISATETEKREIPVQERFEVNKSRQEVPPRVPQTRQPESREDSNKAPVVPTPKPTVPVLKPQKTRLATSPDAFAQAKVKKTVSTQHGVDAKRDREIHQSEPSRQSGSAGSSAELSATPVGSVNVAQARVPSASPDMNAVVNRFYKAAMTLAGAVAVLAVGVIFLALSVWRRKGTAENRVDLPVPASEEEDLLNEPEQPPMRLVMVKGDYAVVDQGLENGLSVGDLLLLKREVKDGEYEIGMARVLKVFERLSGIKRIEKYVDTELRVGDLAYHHRPAEPTVVTDAAVTLQRVDDAELSRKPVLNRAAQPRPASVDGEYEEEMEDRYLPSRGRWRYR